MGCAVGPYLQSGPDDVAVDVQQRAGVVDREWEQRGPRLRGGYRQTEQEQPDQRRRARPAGGGPQRGDRLTPLQGSSRDRAQQRVDRVDREPRQVGPQGRERVRVLRRND